MLGSGDPYLRLVNVPDSPSCVHCFNKDILLLTRSNKVRMDLPNLTFGQLREAKLNSSAVPEIGNHAQSNANSARDRAPYCDPRFPCLRGKHFFVDYRPFQPRLERTGKLTNRLN